MNAAAIQITDLTKVVAVGFWGRKKTLLSSVAFAVPAGCTVGFVGANGAGKSTTLKHLIGASRPTSGSVQVLGADPLLPSTRARLGYMPEQPYLPPTLTALEVCGLHAKLYGGPAPGRVASLLDRVGLGAHQRERIGGYSKGMQTRLCLALALLHDPELLVLDEPMSGLDPVGRQLVRTLLREEAARKRTILFSSHVLADVEALCDRVIAIDRGRIVFDGPTSSAVGGLGTRFLLRVVGGDLAPNAPGIVQATREGDTWSVLVDGRNGLDVALELRAAGRVVSSVEPERARLEDRLVGWMSGSAS